MEDNKMNGMRYRIRVKIGEKELEVEGDKDFVTETCLNLHARLLEIPKISALEQSSIIFDDHNEATFTSNGRNLPVDETPNGQGPSIAKPLPVASYLRKSGASTDSDKALVIAAYLYEYRGKVEFTKTDIEQCYREAQLKKSSNVSRDINNNRKKGYFDVDGENEGLMSFYITQEGLAVVKAMIS